ncbi:MAG: hypothetical protein IJV03_02695 [Alphaproteobacteria bacterium]|nr:hypothetical protein [Alphaproteobacteria bacterium]
MAKDTQKIDKNELRFVLGTYTISYCDDVHYPYSAKFIECTNILGQEEIIKSTPLNDYGNELEDKVAFVERGDTILVSNGKFIRNLTQERLKAKLLAEHAKLVR